MKRNALLFFLLVAFAAQLQAQATLSIQGVIKNSDGTAVSNGKYSLQFKLYTSASGGTAVWSETQDAVQVTGGIYSALLGEVNPLTAAFDQPYYLGVAVEGGAELVPRARLTSSPYALSLIGQGNAFPSSGPVGVGTATPAAGVELHVKDGSGDAVLSVESPGNVARIWLKDADQTGELRVDANELHLQAKDNMPLTLSGNKVFLSHNNTSMLEVNSNGVSTVNGAKLIAGNGYINSGPGQDLLLQRDGADWMRFADWGGLVIKRGIKVEGSINSVGYGSHAYLSSGGAGTSGTGGTSPVGIDCSSYGIHAQVFRAVSDRRIKKNFRLSDSSEDLAKLMRLRITDYQYVDEVEKGSSFYKGLVAQEVEEIMPAAVATTTGFVPDIFSLSESTAWQGGQLVIHTASEHQLRAGDEVRLILENEAKELIVAATPDSRSFAVSWTEAAPERVFVYGKKVADFHQVDYDQVHNLAISAIQELSRQVDALKAESAGLKAENAGLKTDLKAAVDGFERRLRALEANLSH